MDEVGDEEMANLMSEGVKRSFVLKERKSYKF